MYYVVSGIYNFSGISYGNVTGNFENPVCSLSNDCDVHLNGPDKYWGLTKHIIPTRIFLMNDSISSMAHSISLRYFFISLSINELALFVQLLTEIRIADCAVVCQVDFAAEHIFKCILEIKEIIGGFHQRNVVPVEINAEIYVAFVVEAVCKYRTEYPQLVNVKTFAEFNDFVDVYFDKVHIVPFFPLFSANIIIKH